MAINGVSQTGSGVFALARSRRGSDGARQEGERPQGADAAETDRQDQTSDVKKGANGKQLRAEEQQQVAELRKRDVEVRQHEAAHQAAGGAHAGAASFTYQRGPDGKNYAIGGEVQVDVSSASTPQATIAKMEQIKAAALAPSEPSSQDQSVAAQAEAIKSQARQELNQQQREEAGGGQADPAQGGVTGAARGGSDQGGQTPTGSAESRRAAGAYAAAAGIGRSGAGAGVAVSA